MKKTLQQVWASVDENSKYFAQQLAKNTKPKNSQQ